MILENKFLYTRVLESSGKVTNEFTFAGAMLAVIATMIVIVAVAVVVFPQIAAF